MHVLYSFPHALGKPGIGTTALHQVQGLVDEGVEVTLFCTSVRVHAVGVRRTVETLAWRGRRIPHRAIGVARAYRYHDRRVARALARLESPIDLVHTWPRASVQTSHVARWRGIPAAREVPSAHTGFVYEQTAREAEALGMEASPGSHSFDPQTLSQEEEEFRASDYLLVPSEFSRRTFEARGLPGHKLVPHRYGVDLERFDPAGREADEQRPFTATFMGRGEPIKGLHYALEAWLRSGAAERGRLIICGTFAEGYREVLGELLEHPSVEVRGFTDDPAATMRESDILLLPSVAEGSALVTYEAQAAGCVPVVSDATGAECEHLETGMVHPAGDVDALTEQVGRLSSDRELLARLRRNVLERRQKLSWDEAAKDLVAAYERCVGDAAPDRG